jgi:hypothetical protein
MKFHLAPASRENVETAGPAETSATYETGGAELRLCCWVFSRAALRQCLASNAQVGVQYRIGTEGWAFLRAANH